MCFTGEITVNSNVSFVKSRSLEAINVLIIYSGTKLLHFTTGHIGQVTENIIEPRFIKQYLC